MLAAVGRTRKIAGTVIHETTGTGTGTASQNTTAPGIVNRILAELPDGKRRALDDLVDSFEQCDLNEPGHVYKRRCTGLGGDGDGGSGLDGQSVDKGGLSSMWLKRMGDPRYSVRDGLKTPSSSPLYIFEKASSGGASDASSEDSSECSSEGSSAASDDDVGSQYSDYNDGEYDFSDAGDEAGSEWDSDDLEGDLAYMKDVLCRNHPIEAAKFITVQSAIEDLARGEPPMNPPPFVRCSLCLDTQLSILGLPIFKPIYRDDIRRLEPGVVLRCGHMFCKPCWAKYVEGYHNSIADGGDNETAEQVDGSPNEEDNMEVSYADDPNNEGDESEVSEEEEEEEEELPSCLFCPVCHIKLIHRGCGCELIPVDLPINERDPAASLEYKKKHYHGRWEEFPTSWYMGKCTCPQGAVPDDSPTGLREETLETQDIQVYYDEN
jgi:hypothetical protein